jgi:hypothetical protein
MNGIGEVIHTVGSDPSHFEQREFKGLLRQQEEDMQFENQQTHLSSHQHTNNMMMSDSSRSCSSASSNSEY